MNALIWVAGIVVALVVVDRLLLWIESRGWLYYRRTKPRGGAAVYHLLEMSSTFDPSIQQVIEVKVKEERKQEESGEPPGPGRGPSDLKS